MLMNFDEVRRMALALPGVEEGTSYGTPAFRVRGKFFCRLREDGDSLVLKCNVYERRYLVDDLPDVFYVTDHYRDFPPSSCASPPSPSRCCASGWRSRGGWSRRRSWSRSWRRAAPPRDLSSGPRRRTRVPCSTRIPARCS